MAKGKHATALFEVIHASKQFGNKQKQASTGGGSAGGGGLLRTPKWWFKSRKKSAEPSAEDLANDPTLRPITAGHLSTREPARAEPAPEAAPVSDAAPDPNSAAPPAEPPTLDETGVERDPPADVEPAPASSSATRAAVAATPATVPTAAAHSTPSSYAAGRKPAVDLLVDSKRHQITFRLTYTSALVGTFAVLVIVALAYIIGRSMSRGPAQAMGGPTSEQLLKGPANPDVLNVGTGNGAAGAPLNAQPTNRSTAPPINIAPPPKPAPRTSGTTGTAAAPNTSGGSLAENGRRAINLNYAIIQGYPDEASAKAAVEILQQNGVPCTIEKGLRGLNRDWFIVVGLEGFARISSPEYQAHEKKIRTISDKFIGKRSFKAFEPMPYKWDRQ
jgi:hypothetical protein